MKEANLISVLNAHQSLPQDLFESYKKYHSIIIRDEELKDLDVLVKNIRKSAKNPSFFDKYFIGYRIPQIGKEFDLLRIDKESVVNIEIKKISTLEKVKAQLVKNKYYLSFLKKTIHSFSYVADDNKLFSINEKEELVEVHLRVLLWALASQNVKPISDINTLFKPSNYLVSPFNSTAEFIKGNYFLTPQQDDFKKIVLKEITNSGHSIIAVKGRAGTGKTLLTYDLAKEVLNKKETLIVHCGILNLGHEMLRDVYAWPIIPAAEIMKHDLSKYHLIVIDEAQRIFLNQFEHIIKEVKRIGNKIIFSYDGQQTLKKVEINNNIAQKIENQATLKPVELTIKIRTNKEVACFIQCLIFPTIPIERLNYSNIAVNYFDDYEEAKLFMIQKKKEDWKIINYTPLRFSTLPYEIYNLREERDNAHTVIGQEFDNVIAVIDEHFCYKEGRLSTVKYRKRPIYHPTKMFFQMVSRARIKLGIVIVKNQEVLKRSLEILDEQK